MERNANYALVGLASTILLIAMMIFAVWLGHFAFDQKFAEYDVVFQGPVRGLSQGGEVHFNGIKVGEISHIALDPKDPTRVIATAKVAAEVPIRVDSEAVLEPQGITGVNYVQIGAGTPSKPLLRDAWNKPGHPQIKGRPDALSGLLAGSGNVIQRAADALERVNRVLSDENIKSFSATLSDVQAVTAELRQRKAIIADAQRTLQSADQAAQQIRDLAHNTNGLVTSDGARAIKKLADAAAEIQAATHEVRGLIAKIDGPTGDFATTTLPQLQSAIASLQQTTDHLDHVLGEVQQSPQGLLSRPPAREVEVKP